MVNPTANRHSKATVNTPLRSRHSTLLLPRNIPHLNINTTCQVDITSNRHLRASIPPLLLNNNSPMASHLHHLITTALLLLP